MNDIVPSLVTPEKRAPSRYLPFRSLRWRLQVWHALVLTTVLTVFGMVVYVLAWQSRLQQIDAELDRTEEVIMSRLRRLFPGQPPFRGPNGEEVLRGERDRRSGNLSEPSLGLPDEFLHLFQGDADSRLYFVVWDRHGKVLQKSDSALDVPFPGLKTGEDRLPIRQIRVRGPNREVVRVSRFDNNVVVGRSIERDLRSQHASGVLLALAGLGVLTAGLLGGWWTTSLAIRPIAAMTAAAESISAQQFSRRIDLTETDSELGQLATVLNRTFDRLQAAFDQQTRFTADASHELRTPVSVILTRTDLALSRQRSAEEYRSALETCRNASLRMKSLIDGLLTLARFDSAAAGLHFVEFDLQEVAQESLDMLKPLADEKQLQMTSHLEPVIVRGDRDRMSQVIVNLLANSIRYSQRGGSIQITVTSQSRADRVQDTMGIASRRSVPLSNVNLSESHRLALVSVADKGIGIPDDERPHIFDRFYRVDKARSSCDGSVGLGLSICQTIVVAHGGTIDVQSELGVGTTVNVRLPLVSRRIVSQLDVS